MPNSVDTRIVEMQFDNAKFERKVRQSIKTLHELDSALQMKDAGKGFEKMEEAANNIDLSNLERSAQRIERRFSLLGERVRVIQNRIIDSIESIPKKAFAQMKTGGLNRALNIEQAKFQLKGLKLDVDEITKNALAAVKGTAYGFDEAAKAAASFGASGIKAGEQMEKALTGVSGVAAMTGRDYSSIADIFTTIASNGKLMTMQLRQFSASGLNVSAALAKEFKTTEAEINEMVQKGKISFAEFSDAMYNAFGEHAKEANNTFKGALSNMKAALSRIGADAATPYIENMRLVFVRLTQTIDEVHESLKPFLSILEKIMVASRRAFIDLLDNEKFISIYQNGIKKITDVITNLYNMVSRLTLNRRLFSSYIDIINGIGDAIGIVADALGFVFKTAHPVFELFNNVIGISVRLLAVVGRMISSLRKAKGVADGISIVLRTIKSIILIVIGSILSLAQAAINLGKSFVDLPIVKEIFNDISDAVMRLAEKAFPILAGAVGAVVSVFSELIHMTKDGKVQSFLNRANDAFTDFYHNVKSGNGVLKSFVNIFRGGFKKLPGTMTAFAASVDYANESISKTVKPGGIVPGLHGIHIGLEKVGDSIQFLANTITTNLSNFGVGRGLIVGLSASLIALLASGAKLARTFSKAFGGVPALIKAMTESLEAPLFEAKSKAVILGLAVSIGALAASLFLLSKTDTNKLKTAGLVLGGIIALMTTAALLINRLGNGFDGFKNVTFSFISFSGSIILLASALKIIAELDIDGWELARKVLALAAVMAAMGGVFIAITKFSKPFSVVLGSGFLLSFAFAVKMLVKSLAEIAKMDLAKLDQAMPILASIMGKLALVAAACTMLSPFAGLSFMAIAGGVLGFLIGINVIAELIDPDKFWYVHTMLQDIYDAVKGWLILFGIAALIGSIAKLIISLGQTVNTIASAIKGVTNGANTIAQSLVAPAKIAAEALKTLTSAVLIGTIIASLVTLAIMMKKLSEVPEDVFQNGMIKMAIIAGFLVTTIGILMILQKGILKDTKFMDGIGEAFGSIALLLLSIAASLKIISTIPDDSFAKAAVTTVVALGIVAGLMLLVNYLAKNEKAFGLGIKAALAMSTLILSITLAVGLLSMLVKDGNWVPIIAASAAVGIVCAGIAAICANLAEVKTGPALAATVGIAAIFIALTASFVQLQNVNFNGLLPNLIALGVSIGVLSGIFFGLSKLGKDALAGAGALAVITVIFGGFVYAFTILQNVDFNGLLPNLIAIGAAVVVLSGIAFGLGKLIADAALGVVALGLITGIFWALVQVAQQLALINPTQFLENIKVLGIAVVGLTAIVAALGAAIYFSGGQGAIVILAGAAALIVLAGAMAVISAVGNSFANTATNMANAFNLLGPAIGVLGDGIAHLAGLDFSGILGNVAAVVSTIEALSLVSFDAFAASEAMSRLGETVSTLSDYTATLVTILPQIETSATNIVTYVNNLTTAFSDLSGMLTEVVNDLSSDEFYKVISSIGDVMRQYSEPEMKAIGIKMVDDIKLGMDEELLTEAPLMISDFVGGLKTAVFNENDEITSLGVLMGGALVEGFRSKYGIDSHSDSKEAIRCIFDWVGGLITGAKNNSQKIQDESGKPMGKDVVNGAIAGVEEQTPQFITSLGDMLGQAQDVASNNPIIVKVMGQVDQTLQDTGLFTNKSSFQTHIDQRKQDAEWMKIHRQQRLVQVEMHKAEEAEEAETGALGANTDATGKSSKAKKENAKANEKKTKEIKEETDALDEESEAVEENTIDYQALAEEIEVVTEKFNEDLNWQGLKIGNKVLKSLKKALSDFWSTDFSKNDINATFESVRSSLKSTTDYVAKGTYRFNDSDKLIKKLSTSTMLSSKKIKKEVEKTGRTVIKVFEGQMKVFQKNQNGIEKFTLAVPKSTKNLAKFAKQALNFSKSLDGINVENIGDSKTLIENLRGIEKYFVKFKDASKSAQSYMKQVFTAFDEAGFKNSMNILGKNIDGVGSIMSKNSKATAYVEDAFISLAATLYDGSEAANQYATEHARLLFLLEHGEATEEEVAEHERAYIKRITDALVEYRNTLVDTLTTQMDIWKEFDKGTIEGGAETLLKNIESQIAGYQNWGNMLMELSKRGVDKDLMKTLTDEGVKSYGKLEAMLQMTREQLALFNQDFKLSQQMIEQTADTALAAMANATTRASQRAAAQKGNKVAQAQLKLSKKTVKQMKEEYEAVAKAVVTTDKVTKKQEKEYLKTLTKQERKEYKKAKKELKAAEAEERRLAEQERARIAEENRLKTVLDSIKTMDDYIKVITEYNNDSAVMTNITNKMSEAFKDMGGVISNISTSTGDANEAFLMFAESLDATGKDGLNYFEEMAARVQKFTDSIKDSIKGVNLLTTAFGTAQKLSLKDIYESNVLSNIAGNATSKEALSKLSGKGYNAYVLKNVIDTFNSDRAQGIALMNELNSANTEYVEKINAAYELAYQEAEEIANKAAGTIASGTSKAGIENSLKREQAALDDLTNRRKEKEDLIADYQAKLQAIQVEKNTVTEEKQRKKAYKEAVKNGAKLSKAQEKEYIKLLKKYGGSYNGKKYVASWVDPSTEWANQTKYFNQRISELTAEVGSLNAEEQKRRQNIIDLNKKLAEYNANLAKYLELVKDDARIKAWFDTNITSIDAMADALKKFASSAKEVTYLKGKIADVMDAMQVYATGADGLVKENSIGAIFDNVSNFANIKLRADESNPFTILEDGILRFGESLVDATENAEDFYATLKQGLIDYQKELKNTIASSSDFFSMFEPDTDTTANDYLEYADSQIEGLKNWQEYLKKIADMGLDKEIVEKFASQGLSSYTQVSAWANATAEQIGEYNKLWQEYNKSVETASNSAMASIAAAWSKAGQSLQDSMISSFLSDGAERLKNAGYEASAMVITGIQDGLTNAMPTIISAIEKSAKTTTMASAIGKEVGESINTGLVQAISSTVTDTVNSAVEKFKMAVDSVNSYVQETLPTEYTITIHVDTSEFDAAVARMNAAISGTNVQANQTASAVTQSNENRANASQTTEPVSQVTNNVTFNQTNTSPKALSQVDIYRNTQNQLNDYRVKLGLGG